MNFSSINRHEIQWVALIYVQRAGGSNDISARIPDGTVGCVDQSVSVFDRSRRVVVFLSSLCEAPSTVREGRCGSCGGSEKGRSIGRLNYFYAASRGSRALVTSANMSSTEPSALICGSIIQRYYRLLEISNDSLAFRPT